MLLDSAAGGWRLSSAAGLPPSCQVVALADSLPDHLGSGESQLKPDRRRPSPSSHTCVLQIIEDLKEECGKHGTVVKVVVPRPSPPSIAPQVFGTKGYGKVNCCPLPDCHLPVLHQLACCNIHRSLPLCRLLPSLTPCRVLRKPSSPYMAVCLMARLSTSYTFLEPPSMLPHMVSS